MSKTLVKHQKEIGMKKLKLLSLLCFLCASMFVVSCSSDDDSATPTDETSTTDNSATEEKPSALAYSPAVMNVKMGETGESAMPTVSGTAPITFTMTSSPDAGADITIDASTGKVMTTATLAVGTYKVSVTATNSVGSTDFADALEITVSKDDPKVTFDADIKPLMEAQCSPCHTSGSTSYTIYANAKDSYTKILDRVERDKGAAGFMPQGGDKMSTTDIDLLKQWNTDGLLEN